MVRSLITLIIFSLLPIFSVNGEELKFAVVPKFYSVFFDQSGIGCKDAAAQIKGVECIYRGPDIANVRVQDQLINQLIDEGIDGIAVAITQSKFLVENSLKRAKEAGIPIITYDSDFDGDIQGKAADFRAAYIGTNNFELGKSLGEQLKKLRPNGGTLIMQTGRPDSPNLNLRLMGVRSALSGKIYDTPPGDLLNNEQGWTEVREPFLNFDQLDRAVKQMESVMKGKPVKADSFIAVGGWPQNNETLYREMIAPYKAKVDNKEVIIIITDASPSQLTMLKDNLAHINVGQNPYEMGRQAILTLHKIVTKQEYDDIIYTPMKFCTPDNYDSCAKIATPEPAGD
ncbi:substrate-binding domain-containing protein [Shewanella psychrotolerans]|uniref:substrate-binding domain-containing protein n=1 Tax=Shewanella psychrotolerans TaxID=2864206 RepID=UPI001C65DB60|nr:substrate-binding domain-containing protein [Shewanella psychrotolerans]QYK00742.1 substrate-binding domain-containing protein [Shewanella psychrotolerans]